LFDAQKTKLEELGQITPGGSQCRKENPEAEGEIRDQDVGAENETEKERMWTAEINARRWPKGKAEDVVEGEWYIHLE